VVDIKNPRLHLADFRLAPARLLACDMLADASGGAPPSPEV
jgi:hypothetical protein